MLTRRHIRVKVMQGLYAMTQTTEDSLEKEKKFLDGITEKYGQGTLNPETGEFTPNKS